LNPVTRAVGGVANPGGIFPYLFAPTFYPHRLGEPAKAKNPSKIFVCSMGDLFGAWVSQSWIDEVLTVVRNVPRHTFIFLTKNPQRLPTIDWPPNAWVGATVDRQERVEPTYEALKQVKASVRFVSCEPLLEDVEFPSGVYWPSHEWIEWLIIGAQSRTTNVPAFQPEFGWVLRLLHWARGMQVPVFMKDNLEFRLREFPA
jgi:protein gp37